MTPATRYPRVTITGADERTDLDRLAALPVEVGILYSAKRNGREPRYPSIDLIEHMVGKLPRTALHVCGSIGRSQAIAGELPVENLAWVDRIQVNGNLDDREVDRICFHYPAHTVITQLDNPFGDYLRIPRTTAPNHALLLDGSGGRGEYPSAGWRRPDDGQWTRPVGFAGGLGLDNVTEVLEELTQLHCIAFEGHRYNWWIDMEGRVRGEGDWLDLDKVQAVVERAYAKLGPKGYFRRLRP